MARQTSAAAYQQAVSSGLLGRRQLEVFDAIVGQGPITAQELVKAMGYPHAEKRLSELREMGLIGEAGTGACGVTGRNVLLWAATGNAPIPRAPRHKIPPMPTRMALDACDALDDLDALDNLPSDLKPLRDWLKETYLP